MITTTFLRKLTLVLVSLFFASCDKDYNTIGSDIIGAENFNFKGELFDVKAYNQKVTAVETSNLATNQLGIIDNVIFGKTTANFATQLTLAIEKPVIKSNAVIDSVVLTIPYFSTKIFTDTDGRGDYVLNGMYTTNTVEATPTTPKPYDPIDLKVFRNGVSLRYSDPLTLNRQKYYSDEDPNFNTNKIGMPLNTSALASENTAFVPSTKEYKKYKVVNNAVTAEVESRDTPRMRLHLEIGRFQTDIIDAARNPTTAINFETNNVFKMYYKGLYFQTAESILGKGTSMNLDFTKGDITIYYKQDVINNDTAPIPAKEMASLTLNMTGNTVNLFNNIDNSPYTTAVTTPDRVNGDSKLYLKGGQGAMAFIELFPTIAGTTKQTLVQLKAKNVLVNEASLTFTVDKTGIPSDYQKPLRIYIFDADNNIPLYDYSFDNSTSTTNALLDKATHGGIIETVGTKDIYKVRITQHILNILRETTGVTRNVRLGVVVSDNINTASSGNLFTLPGVDGVPAPMVGNLNKKMYKVPFSSITNPLGTVLYGTNTGTPTDDIKFEIYYTEPK